MSRSRRVRIQFFGLHCLVLVASIARSHQEYRLIVEGVHGGHTNSTQSATQRKLQTTTRSDEEPLALHVASALKSYFSNEQLAEHMRDFTGRCGHMSRMFSIGKSSQKRELWALEISRSAGTRDAKPNVKYVANMHGDEPTGRQLLLALAEWLCASHTTDPRARRVVDDMHLFLIPSVNPDGFQERTRGNAAGVDMNRDFPDPIERGAQGLAPSQKEQPEVAAIMAWASETHFVSSGSLHEGAIVANYPYDGSADRGTHYEACPDDATFVHLAHVYASKHATMHGSSEFKGGITNGAQWYPVFGGMQDWMYLQAKCLELTLELSQNKWPPAESLPRLFQDNLPAFLAFHLEAAFGGVRGFVVEEDAQGESKGVAADVWIDGINYTVPASPEFGAFFRPLAPGEWTLHAQAAGYKPAHARVTVPDDGSGTQLNITLIPLAEAAAQLPGDLMEPRPASALPRPLGLPHHTGPVLRTRVPGGILGVGGQWSKPFQSFVLIVGGLAVIQVVRAGLSWGTRRREIAR